jgi:hypothetical protein
VAEFIVDGLTAGQPTVVIARPRHRAGIVRSLRARGLSAAHLEKRGDLLMYDAESTLAAFFIDGHPDPVKFAPIHASMLDALNVSEAGIRLYGEMVDVLCERGLADAALELEGLWSAGGDEVITSMLCGLALQDFSDDERLRAVYRTHSHIVSAVGDLTSAG